MKRIVTSECRSDMSGRNVRKVVVVWMNPEVRWRGEESRLPRVEL